MRTPRPYINRAAAMQGEEIQEKIKEIKDKDIPKMDRWLVLETLANQGSISDDEYDTLAEELDSE